MTMEQENALIRRALLGAAELDLGALSGELPPPSPLQAKRMKAMLADPFGYARRLRRPVWKKALHTAAMIAVTAALSISLLSAASPTVRAAIKAWFMEIRRWDIVYYFTGETKDEELPYYTITELPEGYTQTNVVEGPFSRHITYENTDGQKLRFSYTQMQQGAALSVKTKNAATKNITINGCHGILVLPYDSEIANTVIWTDDIQNIQFVIDAPMEETALLHIAENISLCKTDNP